MKRTTTTTFTWYRRRKKRFFASSSSSKTASLCALMMMMMMTKTTTTTFLDCGITIASGAPQGLSLRSDSGVTPVVEKTYEPEEKHVNGLVQAGFPREKAEKVLRAIGNENCCGPQIKWLFAHDLERNKKRNEKKKHESCFTSEHTDYDGYANVWGNQNKQPDAGACCQSCKEYVPKAPNYYPCNVWVYCPKEEGYFAPAAGTFEYQDCWLKYQNDPVHVHVNMKGEYSAEYRATHPTAGESVDWTAGVVLTEEEFHRSEGVLNHTWSARSHWRKLLDA